MLQLVTTNEVTHLARAHKSEAKTCTIDTVELNGTPNAMAFCHSFHYKTSMILSLHDHTYF